MLLVRVFEFECYSLQTSLHFILRSSSVLYSSRTDGALLRHLLLFSPAVRPVGHRAPTCVVSLHSSSSVPSRLKRKAPLFFVSSSPPRLRSGGPATEHRRLDEQGLRARRVVTARRRCRDSSEALAATIGVALGFEVQLLAT